MEERVTKNPDSLVALSIQFRVDPFSLTLLKVKEVTSPLTVVGGVKRYILLEPFVVELILGTSPKAKVLVLKTAALLTVFVE